MAASMETGSQSAEAQHILDEAKLQIGSKKNPDGETISLEAKAEAAKDKVDDAVPKGPKKADASSGGRVQVGEKGDLKELAAERNDS
ncbi:hypothetical protein PG996_006310 [Apiospora saccharicola]|uniref:SMP domain-containing protein n=1 Tax=Apiospora saccharicola TaxID=335842 RepID=A0ABR1VP09_9PEZI